MSRTKTLSRKPLATHAIESLEERQLFSAHTATPRGSWHTTKALHAAVLKTATLTRSSGITPDSRHTGSTTWAKPPLPLTPLLTSTGGLSVWHVPLAVDSPLDPAGPQVTRSVNVTIGAATGKTDQSLGINIGSSSSYAAGNVVNNLLAQGGSFELANGRIIVHAVNGSTHTTLVVGTSWLWQSIGYANAIGQTLFGSTGPNMHGSWTITDIRDQLNPNGTPTGNTLITIAGAFASIPTNNDAFFVQIRGNPSAQLADDVQTAGNVTIVRDNSTAFSGNSSALFTFGAGTSNKGTLKYYFGADGKAGREILQPGHTYQLSFWAKTAISATARLALYQAFTGANNTVNLIGDGQWHQYTLNVNATGPIVYNNAIASIDISGSNGTVNVDVVKLIDLSDQIAANNPLSAEAVRLIQQYGLLQPPLLGSKPPLRQPRRSHRTRRRTPHDHGTRRQLFPHPRPSGNAPALRHHPYPDVVRAPHHLDAAGDSQPPRIPGRFHLHSLRRKRAADGHPTSWFNDISMIHFEAGNESWNGTFFPNSYNDFDTYFNRAEEMFHDIKTDPLYPANANKLSLIANGWQWNTWFDQQAIAKVPDADAIDASAYTSGPNTQMNMNDLLSGVFSQQLADDSGQFPTSTFSKPVMIYEEAPGELNGGLSAATESAYATSLAAGIATIHNAAVLERDYGISLQNLFTLYQSGDNTPEGYAAGHYGIFADQLTAETNPRPVALAAKLLNQANGQILASSVSDGWTVNSRSTQAIATTTQAADALVTYDGTKLVITLFNDTVPDNEATNFNFTLPTSIAGRAITANWAAASCSVLAGPSAASNNETAKNVSISNGTFSQSGQNVSVTLTAHSMASLVIPLL